MNETITNMATTQDLCKENNLKANIDKYEVLLAKIMGICSVTIPDMPDIDRVARIVYEIKRFDNLDG